MKENENARQKVSTTTNQREQQAGDIIVADSLYNNSGSSNLMDSVLERALRDRPANEDMIRGIA